MGPERRLENSIVRWCHQQGYRCLKLQGPKGWPDRTVYAHGKIIHIEIKAKTKLSRHQKIEHAWLSSHGYDVHTVESLMDVQLLLKQGN